MKIEVDDLSRPVVLDLLAEHLADMHATSPPDSVHALDLSGLQAPGVTFWTVWADEELLGCCALKDLDGPELGSGEIKSMRTPQRARRRGAATFMVSHLIEVAHERGYRRLYLETGSQDFFAPVRELYRRHAFAPCAPFADYTDDPHSAFFSREIAPDGPANRSG